MDDLIERLRVEPTASQFLRIGDLVESLIVERKEAADRIAALEAEKAERERQEPVAWVLFDDIFIAPKDMQDDPPNLECMKPLYAHPLALREPALSQAAAYIERLQSQKRQTQHGIESLRDYLREHAEREGQPYRFFYEMCGTLLKEMAK